MKKLALTLAALSALAACGNNNDDMGMQPMPQQQPTMVMSEPTMNKL